MVIDLASGLAAYAGAVTNIENVVTGAGSDTIIGALKAVLLYTGSGTDTLDLAAVASDLTITIRANGTVSVSDGSNAVLGITGIENIVGGYGKNTYLFEDGASLAGTITGSAILKGTILASFLFIGFVTQNIGLTITTASKSAFITGMMVVFVPLLQVVIEKRPPRPGNVLGVAIVTLGLWFLTSPTGESFNVGDALTMLCATELAERAGISQSMVARIEAGSVDPRTSTLKKIVHVLNTAEKSRMTAAHVMHTPVFSVQASEPVTRAVES